MRGGKKLRKDIFTEVMAKYVSQAGASYLSRARTKIKYENEMSIEENISFPSLVSFARAKFGVYYFSRIIRSIGWGKN